MMNVVADNARLVALRRVVSENEPFLLQVYASTRAEELAGWDDRSKEAFLAMQYALQKADHENQFPHAI